MIPPWQEGEPSPRHTRRPDELPTQIGNPSNLNRLLRVAGPLLVAILFLLPDFATAEIVLITFDQGFEDPTVINPGGEIHGPFDWLESGVRIAGFWAIDIGTPGGQFQQGHLHPQPSFGGSQDGIAENMHAWTDDLQGLYITIENGATFSVVSIDYSMKFPESTNPSEQRYAWSFAIDDAQLMLATSFDPTLVDIEGQWTPFSAPTAPFDPWFTRPITGFDDVSGVFITQTAGGLKVDTIVIAVAPLAGGTPVPLSPIAAMGLALLLSATGIAALRIRRN